MKRNILLSACALALPALFPVTAAAQAEKYLIDQYHTVPYFEVDRLGFATMRGRFDRATGNFSIDRERETEAMRCRTSSTAMSTYLAQSCCLE